MKATELMEFNGFRYLLYIVLLFIENEMLFQFVLESTQERELLAWDGD